MEAKTRVSDHDLLNPLYYVDFFDRFMPAFFSDVYTFTDAFGNKVVFKTPQFHREIFNALKSLPKRLLVLSWRGSAKSTLLSFLYPLYASVFGIEKFIVIISDSHAKAKNFIFRIKNFIETNKMFRQIFGVVPDYPWSLDDIVFKVNWLPGESRCRILARGSGQSLRGYVDKVRPTLVILDDVENEENTATEEKRRKIKDWFFSQVLPAIDPVQGKVFLIGTIVHPKCLLAEIYKNEKENKNTEWKLLKFDITTNDQPTWPERFPLSKIEQIKEEFIRHGALDKFYMEYYNTPINEMTSLLGTDRIRFYDPYSLNTYPLTIVSVDAAYSTSNTADYSAIIVISLDFAGNVFVRDYVFDRMRLYDMIDTTFSLYNKYNANMLVLESQGPQKALLHVFERESKTRKTFLNIKEMKTKINKNEKILICLQPLIDDGRLFLLPSMTDLLSQIHEFPNNRHDDLIDSLANAIFVITKEKAFIPDITQQNNINNLRGYFKGAKPYIP